jgi:hypothetical protein
MANQGAAASVRRWPGEFIHGSMTTLNSNFVRFVGTVLVWFLVVMLIGCFWPGSHFKHWLTILNLCIFCFIATLVIWFAVVPASIQFSENEFKIQSRWRGEATLPWSELAYFGKARGVFLLQFNGTQTFLILPQAYSRDEWSKLMSFLESTYPECKASGWVGFDGFKW